MNKPYFKPATTVYGISTEHNLCFGSPVGDEGDRYGGGDEGDYEEGMPVLSDTHSSVWSDEEEEEDL